MKKQIFYLFLWLVIPLQAQWIQQNSGTTENLNDVYCINADTVVVVGNNATILRTTNGGTNWMPVSNPASVNLHQVQFADTQTGYAVGDNGTLLKTTDAGVSWQSLTTNTTENLLALSVVATDTLFVGGTNGLIMKSVDGGNTWDTLNSGVSEDIIKLQMINNVGYALPYGNTASQNYLLKTNNEGNTWSSINFDSIIITDVEFENEMNGFLLAGSTLFKIQIINDSYNIMFDKGIQSLSHCLMRENDFVWVSGESWNGSLVIAKVDINNIDEDDVFWGEYLPYAESMSNINGKKYAVGPGGMIINNNTGINATAINSNVINVFEIFPNPSNGKISIQNKDHKIELVSYSIFDLQGKEIMQENELTGNTINATQLSDGTYVLRLRGNDNNYYTQKLIIKK